MIFCLLFSFSLYIVTILLATRDINEVLDSENKIRKKAVSTQKRTVSISYLLVMEMVGMLLYLALAKINVNKETCFRRDDNKETT